MFDHSITNYMASYNLYKTLDLIFKDFSILRVIIYLL